MYRSQREMLAFARDAEDLGALLVEKVRYPMDGTLSIIRAYFDPCERVEALGILRHYYPGADPCFDTGLAGHGVQLSCLR